MKNPQLSKEQQAVLFDKGTEAPFSGALLYNHDDGDYTCANCGAVLFASYNKLPVQIAAVTLATCLTMDQKKRPVYATALTHFRCNLHPRNNAKSLVLHP